LAVADAAGAGTFDNTAGQLLGAIVRHPDGNLHLGQKRHVVLAAEVAVEVALLPAVALGLAHHARVDAELGGGAQPRLGPQRPRHDRELLHDPAFVGLRHRCSVMMANAVPYWKW